MDRRSFFEIIGAASLALGIGTSRTAQAADHHGARSGKAIEDKLRAMGLELPEPSTPAAVYVPFRRSGKQVFIAGQIPPDVANTRGKVGRDLTVEQGYAAARLVALRILAQLKAACDGDLGRVVQCVQLRGFVNSTDDFTGQSQVINGASELLRDLFGDAGLAARAALGTNALPLGVCCEIESIFEIRG